MKNFSLLPFAAFLFVTLFTFGCSTDSDFNLQEPTYDSVPEPFNISGVDEEPVQDGITKYVVEEGRGEDRVVIRDDLFIFFTLRNMDGDIIYSSYQNGMTSPTVVSVTSISAQRSTNFNAPRAYTSGLRKGLIGMREGEKRVLIVPPSEGLANIQSGGLTEQFRNDTLRYDIELNAIL
ncbi:hypothetical protein DYD21_10000 [Rhodohalobacter sp. SW132]|uniref:FKBP-type peptidyl-prolyl cis-trans isomerase n=1 Tax=Rhodohalobacter sp. SW132 TaxID=2293433 RepID=UPI000E3A7E1A|nr:FKBP-type peptidyl-prolyl cis-trans isomerase [Rhodohalobacter sp. SW132]REL33729.1 hypothetical protein DYD21_10000 [Rhodohalobacter sp. SW132]